MHDHIDVGSVLTIGAPKNHFPLVEAKRTLLLAGGIGVTPILAMAETLAGNGATSRCTTARARRSAPLQGARRRFQLCGAGPLPLRQRRRGQKLDLAALLAVPAPDTHLYVCGPQGFIDHVLDSARASGWPAAQLHVEYFSAAAVDTTATSVRRQAGVERQGVTIPAGPDGDQGAGRAGRRDPVFVRGRRVRHLPDARAGGRAGPPRHVPDRGGAGGERPVHANVLFAPCRKPPGSRSTRAFF
jgi:hypothetical protein